MIYNRSFFICVVLLLIYIVGIDARIFFTGSNPALSSIALPQDLLFIPGGDRISSYTSWQTFPWWGDIDEPENRPYKKYVFTGEKTEEAEYYTSSNQYEQRFGLNLWRSERMRTSYDVTYSAWHFTADAQGPVDGRIPGLPASGDAVYDYHEQHAIREGNFKTILATYYKTYPVGFSLSLGGVYTSRPNSTLILKNDSRFSSPLLLWGWDGDDYQQQTDFAIGSLFKGDLQAGINLSEYNKIGSHFRLYAGRLHNYNWNNNTLSYELSPKKIHNYTIRLYGIYNWFKMERFRFNTTVLTRFTIVDSIGMRGYNNSIVDYKERSKTFVFQINPNVNIFPWKYPMSFIDAALLCNYQHMRYDFLNDRNVPAGTGWWGSIEDFSWERFSYGRENFFELALDIFASIPVFGMKDQSASIVVSGLLWRRYKWFNKYFGNTDYSTGDFNITNIRKNFDKETWLNTVVNLMYRWKTYAFRLDIAQPLIYSLTPKTTIYDGEGNVEGGLTMEKMWLSQAGFKVGFFFSTDLANFIRYQPLARPEM